MGCFTQIAKQNERTSAYTVVTTSLLYHSAALLKPGLREILGSSRARAVL